MSAVSADWQTRAAREREARRAEARAILARYEAECLARSQDPRPAAPSVLFPYDVPDDNREFGREYIPKRTIVGADLADSWYVDGETGCWMWTGRFRLGHRGQRDAFEFPDAPGVHLLCGRSHFMAAKVLKEEQVGYAIPETDAVVGVCPTNLRDSQHPCVNPDHHIVRRTDA